MEKIAELGRTLAEDPRSLLIIVGAVVFVVGVSGTVPYAPISQGYGQIAACLLGLVLVGAGAAAVFGGVNSNPYGVRIQSPPPGTSAGASIPVGGTVRRIPEGKQLWLVRVYPDGMYYPARRIDLKKGQRTWQEQFEVGGRVGDYMGIGAFVIGAEGQALIAYQKDASNLHNDWMNRFDVPKDTERRYLPAFKRESVKALKITECDIVKVIRT
jgi:hypothetical protein